MLCPKLATQRQSIDKSVKGLAFAFRDCDEELRGIGANAQPLVSRKKSKG